MSSHHRQQDQSRSQLQSAPFILPSSGMAGTLVSIFGLKLKSKDLKDSKDSNCVQVLVDGLKVLSVRLTDGVIVFQIPPAQVSAETAVLITVVREPRTRTRSDSDCCEKSHKCEKRAQDKCEKLLASFVFTIDPPPLPPQMTAVVLPQPPPPPPRL